MKALLWAPHALQMARGYNTLTPPSTLPSPASRPTPTPAARGLAALLRVDQSQDSGRSRQRAGSSQPVTTQRATSHFSHLGHTDTQPVPPAPSIHRYQGRATVDPPSLTQRLTISTEVTVGDAQLDAGIGAIFEHPAARSLLSERVVGMARVPLGKSGLEARLAPNRNAPTAQRDGGAHECVFCNDVNEGARSLRWRGWRILANAFPYVPPEFRHIVITAAEHEGQGFTRRILSDMMDLQRCAASNSGPMTLFYNGIAGFTQFHLHWQAVRDTLPLERVLQSAEAQSPQTELKTIVDAGDGAGTAKFFELPPYAGVLISGSKSFALDAAERAIAVLDEAQQTRGHYNLLLLNPQGGPGGPVQLVVIPRRAPRRADVTDARMAPFDPSWMGAFALAGSILVQSSTLPLEPLELAQRFAVAAAQAVVKPSTIAGLDAALASISQTHLL